MRKEEDEDQRVRNLFREITKLLPERSKIKTDLLYFKYAPILVMLFRWYSVSQFYDNKMEVVNCCCENRLAICQQTDTLQNAINNVANGQERGFSNVAYETQRQTCDLHNAIKDSTQTIVDGQKQAEMRELQNKIDALREENSTFKSSAMTSQIVGQAVAPINQVLAGLQNEVAGIKCKLPETVTTPYSPFTAVPNCVAWQTGLYGLNAANNAGFWG